jgi:hypothetical protein
MLCRFLSVNSLVVRRERFIKNVTVLLLAFFGCVLFVAMFAYPDDPEFDPGKTQGLLNFARNGKYINGTQTWEITQIDPAFFSHLRNFTLVRLEISGEASQNGGTIYINDNYVGSANTSQELNEWDVPVEFCNVKTVIAVISNGWNVRSVNLLFFVKFSQVPPWWKQNIAVVALASIAEVVIFIVLARKVGQVNKGNVTLLLRLHAK